MSLAVSSARPQRATGPAPAAVIELMRGPDPAPLLRNLAVTLVEVLAGLRAPEQIARWLDEPALRALRLAARCHALRRGREGRVTRRPHVTVRSCRVQRTGPHSAEGVIVIEVDGTVRAVAARLENHGRAGSGGQRWRASVLRML